MHRIEIFNLIYILELDKLISLNCHFILSTIIRI